MIILQLKNNLPALKLPLFLTINKIYLYITYKRCLEIFSFTEPVNWLQSFLVSIILGVKCMVCCSITNCLSESIDNCSYYYGYSWEATNITIWTKNLSNMRASLLDQYSIAVFPYWRICPRLPPKCREPTLHVVFVMIYSSFLYYSSTVQLI